MAYAYSRLLALASTFTASLLLASPLFAATLQVDGGTVSVNRGQGPVSVTGTTEVKAGDVVSTAPGAQARIIYSNGCVTVVQPGSASTVTFDDHCVLGLDNSNGLLLGAGVVAIGAGAVILLSKDDHKPASP